MIAVVQRVTRASVTVDERIVGAIDTGLLVLAAVEKGEAEDGLALGGALWPFWSLRGFWTEGRQRLEALLALGILTTLPTAAAGLADWSETYGSEQRTGLVHAAANVVALSLFTTSLGKSDDAKRLGAREVVISKDEDAMEKQQKRFDFIIDTVSAPHDLNAYLALLKRDGALVVVTGTTVVVDDVVLVVVDSGALLLVVVGSGTVVVEVVVLVAVVLVDEELVVVVG